MKIIAHRGASASEPENTLAAMSAAIEHKACAIEVDVFRVENELVVIHDRRLETTTNGHGLVENQSLEALSQLDAGNGQRIPTLWQVLELIDGRCDLNIELKGWSTASLVPAILAKAVTKLGYSMAQFLVSSFHHGALNELHQLEPGIKLGALTASCPKEYSRFAVNLGAHSVNMALDFADPKFIADAKANGLKVYVYTVDNPDDMQWLATLGVDGIFTNDPRKARQILESPISAPGTAWQ